MTVQITKEDVGTMLLITPNINADKTVTLRANTFKRSRYKFAGWAKTKTGKVAYKNKAKVKNMDSGEQTELALDESFAEKFSVLQLADASGFQI